MQSTKSIWKMPFLFMISLVILIFHNTAYSGNSKGGAASGSGTEQTDSRFDTSFAIEYSYSCVSGGCHETNSALVNEHAESFMTHAMVKCNACHGTHTADTVGEEKPNLTGYYEGIGITGYQVGDDRCIACHTQTFEDFDHSSKTQDCISCHKPHRFSTKGRRSGKN